MATKLTQSRVLTTLAVLMGLLAISNVLKPVAQTMDPTSSAGFVFFGRRLEGSANAIVGPLFGLVLATYAYGAWTRKKWVMPLAVAYAGYVVVNLILFWLNPPPEPPTPFQMIVYAAVAVGVSAGSALYLYRHRTELG